jgi:hypothetical protein
VKMHFYYANINMRRTWQGYGVRSCLRLMYNRLKIMKSSHSIIPFWGPSSRKFARKLLCVHQIKKLL